MSCPAFHTDDEGIHAASQALDDARALLRRRKTGTASIDHDDRDYALQFQLESLENTLREITDTHFARMLSEGEAGVAVVGDENVGTLMFIVATAQEMVANYNNSVLGDIGLPPGVLDPPFPTRSGRNATSSSSYATTSGAIGGSSIAGSPATSRKDLIDWVAELNLNSSSPSIPTSHSFWDWAGDESLEPPANSDNEPPPRLKGKQRASDQDNIAEETAGQDRVRYFLELMDIFGPLVPATTSGGASVSKRESVQGEEDEILLFRQDRHSISASPPSPGSSLIEGLHQSIPKHHTTLPEPPQIQHSDQAPPPHPIFFPFLRWTPWSSDEGSSPLEYKAEKPLPNLPDSASDARPSETAEASRWFESERGCVSTVPSRNLSPQSLYSDPCVVCGDPSDILESIVAPCGHWYCASCVSDLVTAYINDESLHPLRCCKTAIPICDIEILLCDIEELAQFREKHEEYSTPHGERTYCPQRGCHRFIKPLKAPASAVAFGRWLSKTPDTARCLACHVSVCLLCKELAHPGEKCEENRNTARLHELAKEKQWQTCSKCHSIVERIDGCLHMICRCGYEFCYRCGAEYTGPGMCGH